MPVVICGGFLSFTLLYEELRETLQSLTAQPAAIAEIGTADWLLAVAPPGWLPLLNKLDAAVRALKQRAGADRVTLVGHSAGGVLARLYLGPRPFYGQTYRGLEHVAHLITLGSPHYNQQKKLFGSWMARWVEKRYPGAAFAPDVRYTTVAGKLIYGRPTGDLRERHAYGFYQDIGGRGETWGDGLIPVASALLEGTHQIILDDVGHFAGFGGPWYGETAVIPRWWTAAQTEGPTHRDNNSDRIKEPP
jgi:pimeloyl-ACP methyl ester carboxylesterase